MTAERIYEIACHGVFTAADDDEDFRSFSPALLTMCMLEALPYENMIRAIDGKTPLRAEDIPDLTAVDDTKIDMFDPRIVRLALPYGLKACLLEDDGSRKAEAVLYRNRFIETLSDIAPAVFEDLVDSGEEDDGA